MLATTLLSPIRGTSSLNSKGLERAETLNPRPANYSVGQQSAGILPKLERQKKVKSAIWTTVPGGKWDTLANPRRGKKPNGRVWFFAEQTYDQGRDYEEPAN